MVRHAGSSHSGIGPGPIDRIAEGRPDDTESLDRGVGRNPCLGRDRGRRIALWNADTRSRPVILPAVVPTGELGPLDPAHGQRTPPVNTQILIGHRLSIEPDDSQPLAMQSGSERLVIDFGRHGHRVPVVSWGRVGHLDAVSFRSCSHSLLCHLSVPEPSRIQPWALSYGLLNSAYDPEPRVAAGGAS